MRFLFSCMTCCRNGLKQEQSTRNMNFHLNVNYVAINTENASLSKWVLVCLCTSINCIVTALTWRLFDDRSSTIISRWMIMLHLQQNKKKAVWWPKQYHNFQMDDYVAPTAEQKKQDNLAWKAPDFKQCHT